MSDCDGSGFCLETCFCRCYDEDTGEDFEVCTCGHREHRKNPAHDDYRFCASVSSCIHNCKLIPCNLFELCGMKITPAEAKFCEDMCTECHKKYGKVVKTEEMAECPICYDTKQMISIRCNHKFCWECYKQSCVGGILEVKCPLCRGRY